jgi:hypothetical protein
MKEAFGAAAFGFLLLVIGAWADVEALRYIGILIMPLSFLYGAAFKSADSMALKITLTAIGGIILAASISVLSTGGLLSGLMG